MSQPPEPDCYNCTLQARTDAPPRDRVLRTDHWQVSHAFAVAQPGWLVLAPTGGHVTSFADLSDQAAAELGPLLQRLSRALEPVTGCVKTYQMQFSEAEGYAHLHVHLVPRMPDQSPEAIGPRVFSLMVDDPERVVDEKRRDEIALALRRELAGAG